MIATNKIEKKVLWMILANNEVFKKKSEEEIDHIIIMYHSLIEVQCTGRSVLVLGYVLLVWYQVW